VTERDLEFGFTLWDVVLYASYSNCLFLFTILCTSTVYTLQPNFKIDFYIIFLY